MNTGLFLSTFLIKSKIDAIWEILAITITSWNLIKFETTRKNGRQSV
jgi:hypothetical protein